MAAGRSDLAGGQPDRIAGLFGLHGSWFDRFDSVIESSGEDSEPLPF
jgi:hypothetical protein